MARTFQKTIRGTDAVGRVGGEEFLLIAPDTDLAGAEVLAERLRAEVEGMDARHHGNHIPVTISGGFAVAESGTSVQYDHLRELAAAALAEAKAAGRNRCVVKVYTSEAVAAS
jgi:diguanylate cyclase (GGDEF)-like protein